MRSVHSLDENFLYICMCVLPLWYLLFILLCVVFFFSGFFSFLGGVCCVLYSSSLFSEIRNVKIYQYSAESPYNLSKMTYVYFGWTSRCRYFLCSSLWLFAYCFFNNWYQSFVFSNHWESNIFMISKYLEFFLILEESRFFNSREPRFMI